MSAGIILTAKCRVDATITAQPIRSPQLGRVQRMWRTGCKREGWWARGERGKGVLVALSCHRLLLAPALQWCQDAVALAESLEVDVAASDSGGSLFGLAVDAASAFEALGR
jgi:hypothetical protein